MISFVAAFKRGLQGIEADRQEADRAERERKRVEEQKGREAAELDLVRFLSRIVKGDWDFKSETHFGHPSRKLPFLFVEFVRDLRGIRDVLGRQGKRIEEQRLEIYSLQRELQDIRKALNGYI